MKRTARKAHEKIFFSMRMPGQADFQRLDEEAFMELALKVKAELHLLETPSGALELSHEQGFAVAALNSRDVIVGYTRLSHLFGSDGGDAWLELGATYVEPDYRGLGINKQMYQMLLPAHDDKNILATTTNVVSLAIGEAFGFVTIDRMLLPAKVWQASCCCPKSKTEAKYDDNRDCVRAHGESQCQIGVPACFYRVTRSTAERLRRVRVAA
ncbi:GNAT family N-acetyltransferase [Candidatus Kaiserbacteria bacterium]|nr:GNAT family N-acetyltransferase [Candidatus Kaiserbacteria bacterium]